jgi:hypothetical protein
LDADAYREVSLEAELDRLGPECSSCLRTTCSAALDACREEAACVNAAACRIDDPSPAATWSCGGGTQSGLNTLLACRGCARTCRVGEAWSCVGRHTTPAAHSSTIRWRQQFIDTIDSTPFANATVRACRERSVKCDSKEDGKDATLAVLSWAKSDAQGWFELELPTRDALGIRKPAFYGFLRATGPNFPAHRLHRTEPLFMDGTDAARIFSESTARHYAPILDIAIVPGRAQLLFQVFDCLRNGAEGIVAEIESANADAQLFYMREENLDWSLRATRTDGGGSGGILNLDPSAGLYALTFRRARTGAVLSRAVVTVAADEFTILHVSPGSSAEVAPW